MNSHNLSMLRGSSYLTSSQDVEISFTHVTSQISNQIVRDCITLDDPALLRGVRVNHVLKHWGHMLSESAGNGGTYGLSRQVPHVDAFISHNWSTPRRAKFCALALQFHLQPALCCTGSVALLLTWLSSSGKLPMLQFIDEDGNERYFGGYCLLCCPPLFIIALFCWQEIAAYCAPCLSSVCFLDKACIHQTDENRKRASIKRLAMFLRFARSMLVVYSDAYLQRLWTVYELASFLLLHPGGDLRIIHIFLPILVCSGTLLHWFGALVWCFIRLQPVSEASPSKDYGLFRSYAHLFILLPAVYIACLVLRCALRKQAVVQEHVQSFDVVKAECLVESDRALVHSNIANFMKAMKLVNKKASLQETLIRFNELVRYGLPKAIVRSSGSWGIGYLHAFAIFLSQGLLGLDTLASDLWHHTPARTLVLTFSASVLFHAAILPLLLGAGVRVIRCMLHVSEHRLVEVYLVATALGACCVGIGCFMLINKLCKLAEHSDVALAAWVTIVVMLFAATMYSFRQTITCGLGRRPSLEGTRDLSSFARQVSNEGQRGKRSSRCTIDEESDSEESSSSMNDGNLAPVQDKPLRTPGMWPTPPVVTLCADDPVESIFSSIRSDLSEIASNPDELLPKQQEDAQSSR
eukprot:CAMPEP_0172727972 /NCGR_PEP_ID=MMETSP1074-20121228/91980_1 /TAXON_ID=2916 /ORGANISM="Ceratium fusus, Strain PA161109" /LENGTH=635 /DNA_ID=CAMNT_0013555175 /DNA_START=28 /DNA_END=1935 /DNA_ORIENTATION=-